MEGREKDIFGKINAGSASNTTEKASKIEPTQSPVLPLVSFSSYLCTVTFHTKVVF